MWRYRELLPLDGAARPSACRRGMHAADARRPAGQAPRRQELWVKNDAVNHPDPVVQGPRRLGRALEGREFGFETVGCASTGNLANASRPTPPRRGWKRTSSSPTTWSRPRSSAPASTAPRRRRQGTYDDVNRLCSQIAFKYGWGFVNVNLRPFYAEGSKTMGYEIAEQLGWRAPAHVVVPMAGGRLIEQDPQGVRASSSKLGPDRATPATQDLRRPGGRLQPDHRHGARPSRDAGQAGEEAEHDRQVAGHRRPGRRLLRRAR